MAEGLYFNDKDSLELTDRIFELINNAQKSIKTGNFFFKDRRIIDALLEAAFRGVAIFVLSNLTGSENRGYVRTSTKVETDPHIPNLHELHRHGAHIHLCDDLHAKFLICDSKEGLIMSANYTPDSLYGNPENGVDVCGEELKDLELIFDTLYMHPDTILSEDGKSYRYLKKRSPVSLKAFENIGKKSRLLLTAASTGNSNLKDCFYKLIYAKLVQLTDSAKETLVLVSWSYNQVKLLPEFKKALNMAIKRGVKITLFYGTKGSEKQKERTYTQLVELLGSENVKKMTVPFADNHAKCIITEREGALFTANIDGNKGLLTGFELGCILTEEQRLQSIRKINQILENGK